MPHATSLHRTPAAPRAASPGRTPLASRPGRASLASRPHRLRLALSAAAALTLALASCGGGDEHAGHATPAPTHDHAAMVEKAKETTTSTTPQAALVDAAFVRQMIPHHEMALEMATIAQDGTIEHDQTRELAAAILRTQEEEITQLKQVATDLGISLALAGGHATHGGDETDSPEASGHAGHGGGGNPAADAALAADAKTLGLSEQEMGMSMDMDTLRKADPVDVAFAEQMIPHHEGAIAMAQAQLDGGTDPRLKKLSRAIIAAQQKEIAEMRAWLRDWK